MISRGIIDRLHERMDKLSSLDPFERLSDEEQTAEIRRVEQQLIEDSKISDIEPPTAEEIALTADIARLEKEIAIREGNQ